MKKLISALLAGVLALSLAACSGGSSSAASDASESGSAAADTSSAATAESTDFTGDGFDPDIDYAALAGSTVKVGASPAPHAEILKVAADILAQADITLEVVEFTDYIQPNTATENGDIDANYFQHQNYLDTFNAENGTHLVSVAKIHYEPLASTRARPRALTSWRTAPDPGAQRHLQRGPRPAAAGRPGLIELDPDAGLTATKQDITSNPKNLDIVEMEAAQLPRSLSSADMAVINGNYATQAGFSSAKDALATESADSDAAQIYPNVLVVKEGRENDPLILAVAAALQSDAVRDFINETYGGAVVPLF